MSLSGGETRNTVDEQHTQRLESQQAEASDAPEHGRILPSDRLEDPSPMQGSHVSGERHDAPASVPGEALTRVNSD